MADEAERLRLLKPMFQGVPEELLKKAARSASNLKHAALLVANLQDEEQAGARNKGASPVKKRPRLSATTPDLLPDMLPTKRTHVANKVSGKETRPPKKAAPVQPLITSMVAKRCADTKKGPPMTSKTSKDQARPITSSTSPIKAQPLTSKTNKNQVFSRAPGVYGRALIEFTQSLNLKVFLEKTVKLKRRVNPCPYAGLVNQGATCYMNSLLQTLFFTNQLRKAVYQLPTTKDDPSRSVPLALQRLFYNLQFCAGSVETTRLTQSFGWRSWNSFLMHDVQELSRVLLDNLERKMNGTIVDGTIKALFEGQMLSYIHCPNVDYKSSRTESFSDIQLPVMGKKDVEKSFVDYIKVEKLAGANKYDAGEHGLQDAEKGVIFLNFPPVLHLQLMRFHYDPVNDMNVKIDSRFEFPEVLNLDPYLKEKQLDNPATYVLHTVLVHSGGGHDGHYIVYIDPTASGNWYKFNDDVVMACSREEAISQNFGGGKRGRGNAYMLVYIRKSRLGTVLGEISYSDIPDELINMLKEESAREARAAKVKSEAHLFMPVRIVKAGTLPHQYQGYDLLERDTFTHQELRVHKAASLPEFMRTVAELMHCDADLLRAWPLNEREYAVRGRHMVTFRPTVLGKDAEKENPQTVLELANKHFPWTVFIETPTDYAPMKDSATTLPRFDEESDVFLFVKQYDASSRRLRLSGHLIMSKHKPLGEVVSILNARSGFPDSTPLRLYHEARPYKLDRVAQLDVPLEEAVDGIRTGDILVYEKNEPENTINPISEYYWYLADRVNVIFRKRGDYQDKGFRLDLMLSSTYEEVTTAVTDHLGTKALHLQLYTCTPHGYVEAAKTAVKYPQDNGWKLSEILLEWKFSCFKPLFFELLDIPINEQDQRLNFTCTWRDQENGKQKINIYPWIKSDNCVMDLLTEAHKQLVLPSGGTGKLRLLEVMNHVITNFWDENCSISDMNFNPKERSLRVEEIPCDQLTLSAKERLVAVAHYNREHCKCSDIPFLFKLIHGEKFSQMKKRLQKELSLEDADFESIQFFEVIENKPNRLPVKDFMITAKYFTRPEVDASGDAVCTRCHAPYLRLHHPDPHPGTVTGGARCTHSDSIRIFN